MATDYYTGDNVRALLAINAEVSGMTFDETPGDYDCHKVVAGGGITIEHMNNKLEVDENDVDPLDMIPGGEAHKITVERYLSYSFCEKIFQLWFGGDITTTGSGPYKHEQDSVQKILNGSFAVEYTKQSAQVNEVVKETYSNFVVTNISVSHAPEDAAKLTYTGFATGKARTTTQAALTTENDTEIVSWSHLEVSLHGSTAYHLSEVHFDLGAPVKEGEYDFGSTSQDGNWRDGRKAVSWGMTVMFTETSESDLMASPEALLDGTNYILWNNGGAAAAEREIKVTFGTSYHEGGISIGHGNWGRVPVPLKLKVLGAGSDRVDLYTENGRTTIPA